MQFLARGLRDWRVALTCVLVVAAVALLPGLGSFGLWEPQERQLADKAAPRADKDLDKKDEAAKPVPDRGDPRRPIATDGAAAPPAPAAPLPPAAAATAALPAAGSPPSAGTLPAAGTPAAPAPVAAAKPAPPPGTCEHAVPKEAVARSLGTRAAAWGRDRFGDSDTGRRLPFALLGLFTVLAAAGIAMRAAGPRAGLVTALAALSMPLLALQARQLTSEIGTAAGGTLAVYGLVALGSGKARGFVRVLDLVVGLVALVAGCAIGFYGGGALLGVLVPIGAVAAAGALGVPAIGTMLRAARCAATKLARAVNPRWGAGARCEVVRGEEPVGEQLVALVATLAALALIWILAHQLFHLAEPQPGAIPQQRELLGKAIVSSGCYSPALGGIWKVEDDLRFVYDSMFEQIAYGTFPWGILAPVAMFGLIAGTSRAHRKLGAITLAWAGGAWIASEVFQRKVGFNLWAGFPAMAIAIGVWLDGVLAGAARGDREAVPLGARIIGVFVLFAAIDLGKDLQAFTERLTSLLVGGDAIQYPTIAHLWLVPTRVWVLVLGVLAALGFAIAMACWRPGANRTSGLASAARYGAVAALGATIVLVAFWPFAWQPELATHLSSKAMFDDYRELAKPGDALVLMGDMGDAPHDYAPATKPEVVTTREQVVAALGRPTRVFAIAPQTELCQLHREVGGKPYFVLDDRNVRSILLSNKVDGTTDKNPLRATILHAEPKDIPIRPKGRIVFDNKIELLGWDIPKSIGRGDKLTVRLYYKVLQAVGGTWTILQHFDGPLRFNGDHPPIDGRCTTSTWQPGDYIVDTHVVIAGGGASPKGPYEVWTGFFTGSNPNWKNMPVSEAPGDMRDGADRVKITTLLLD